MTSAAAGFVERLDAVTERLHVLASRENPAGALTEPDPPYGGHGGRPKVPFRSVTRWAAAVPEERWQTIDVRDGAKGLQFT